MPCVEPEFCILSCLNFSPAFELRRCSDGRWKLEGGVGHLSVRWILFSCTEIYLSLAVGGWVSGLTSIKQTRELEPAGCILALQSVRVADVTATTHGWKHKRKISVYISCHVHSQNHELDDTCERSKNTQCGTSTSIFYIQFMDTQLSHICTSDRFLGNFHLFSSLQTQRIMDRLHVCSHAGVSQPPCGAHWSFNPAAGYHRRVVRPATFVGQTISFIKAGRGSQSLWKTSLLITAEALLLNTETLLFKVTSSDQ